ELVGTPQDFAAVGVGDQVLRLESRPDPFVDQLGDHVHPRQGETIAIDRLDVDRLGEPGREIAAVKANARQQDPIGLDLDRGPGKLDIDPICGGLLLAEPVPQIRAGDVILGRTVLAHFLAYDQVWLVVWWRLRLVAIDVGRAKQSRHFHSRTWIDRQGERAFMQYTAAGRTSIRHLQTLRRVGRV